MGWTVTLLLQHCFRYLFVVCVRQGGEDQSARVGWGEERTPTPLPVMLQAKPGDALAPRLHRFRGQVSHCTPGNRARLNRGNVCHSTRHVKKEVFHFAFHGTDQCRKGSCRKGSSLCFERGQVFAFIFFTILSIVSQRERVLIFYSTDLSQNSPVRVVARHRLLPELQF